MELVQIKKGADYAKGWWFAEGDFVEPDKWTFQDRGNGPVIDNDHIWGPYPTAIDALCSNLSKALIIKFSGWVGTDSEELLQDIKTIEDHLSDEVGIDRALLYQLTERDWDKAWREFDETLSTQRGD